MPKKNSNPKKHVVAKKIQENSLAVQKTLNLKNFISKRNNTKTVIVRPK